MTNSKESRAVTPQELTRECCMCGDYGFSYDLFHCKICQFRSQHRYCSNLYPKADTYRICNWCLSQKENPKEKSQNSSNYSSSNKKKGQVVLSTKELEILKSPKPTPLPPQLGRPIKKLRLSERSTLVSPHMKIVAKSGGEDKLRRTRLDHIVSNRIGGRKQVFRNKVRRYKLLDEVSS